MPIRRVGRPGLIGLAARTAVVAGTAQAVSGGMARNQQARAQQAAQQQEYADYQQRAQMEAAAQAAATQYAAPAPPPPAQPTDLIGELQKLAALQQAGVLTDAEFAAAKAKLLS
ncbi:SHOCT domain-containing protein [uncultured Serinicoccus sp.]|uniref:SHOCT domain-containing protein n=1 Tax=uncultured Serinicoccus sp. TaxID=735514 RepID=UPI0026163A05|nr:SHOCT domain-containing protein [uncultured Serinicoccus sp.]